MNPFSYFDIMYLVNCTNDKLGTDGATKSDEFSKKFQTAFDPPPPLIFGKLYCNFFLMNMVAFMQGGIGQMALFQKSSDLIAGSFP